MGTIHTVAPTADAAASGGYGSLLILALPILLLVWMFFTGSRRTKAMREFNSSLIVGDKVITSSGLFGTIRHLDDTTAHLEIADGVIVRLDRRAVAMKQSDAPGAQHTTTDTSTMRDAVNPDDAADQK